MVKKSNNKNTKQTRWRKFPIWLKTGFIFLVVDFIFTLALFGSYYLMVSFSSLQSIAGWAILITGYLSLWPSMVIFRPFGKLIINSALIILISYVTYFLLGCLVGLIIQKFENR